MPQDEQPSLDEMVRVGEDDGFYGLRTEGPIKQPPVDHGRGWVRPIVFLDVDGPLNLWAAGERPAGFVEHRFRVSRWGRRLRMWLNPAHGPLLLGLAQRTGAELVWASTWGLAANATVGSALGLPELPSINFVPGSALGDGQWKFPAVSRFAGDRPLAWFDDDFDLYPSAREAFVARRGAGRVKLVRVDPHVGISVAQLVDVEEWLRVVGAA